VAGFWWRFRPRGKWPWVLLALSGLALFALKPTIRDRFRLTLEIDTPTGVKSASNVYEYRAFRMMTGPWANTVSGDAVFVDLGSGKHIIAILAHGERAQWVDKFATAWFEAYKPATGASIEMGPRDLTEFNIPTLVTFGDIRDPKTARVVYAWGRRIETTILPNGKQDHDRGPELKVDDIAAVFGGGYAFKRAWVEVVPAGIWPFSELALPFNLLGLTGTPVTRGIEKRLPWLGQRQPWMKEISPGVFVDTRTDAFKASSRMFKRS